MKRKLKAGRSEHELFPRPQWISNIVFPDNITQLDAANLSELIGKYTALYCHANSDRALLESEIILMEAEQLTYRGNVLKSNPDLQTLDRFRREALIESSEHYQDVISSIAKLKAKREVASMHASNFDRIIFVLNKELNRKIAAKEDMYPGNSLLHARRFAR